MITGELLANATSDLDMDLEKLCLRGETLACFQHTWMPMLGPSLQVLLLADCADAEFNA